MKFLRRKVVLAFSLAAMATWAYNITGIVADQDGQPLIDATIRLLHASDSAFVKGSITDINGGFKFTGVKNGKYIVEASYIGYEKTNHPFAVKDKNVKLDTLRVYESSVLLDEATVVGIKTPIKVMQDTIEYNADTYQTQPNAVVEDLLKRLPGVEVDSDGKITANGKEVKKILVDGKEFFSDDPKVASKNLPVDMVDKLQVVDRKSDLARLTGVDDGDDETVINLTVKKGMKNGWFGNVGVGYGTDDRYGANFNVNRLWDNNQLTFIGSANNTNGMGFTDGGDGRFQRFGSGRGINESQQFGVNFNVGNEEILRVGGDVMYTHTDRDTRTTTDRQYLFENPRNENSGMNARDRGHNLRADFRLEWKPDSFNTLDFRPSFSYNTNNAESNSHDNLYNSRKAADGTAIFDQLINNSINSSNSKGHSLSMSGRLIYNHSFKSHRGRSFSVMGNYGLNNTCEWTNSTAYTFFNQTEETDQEQFERDNDPESYHDYVYQQYNNNHSWSNNVSARLSWTEPIGNVTNGHFLTLSYNFSYRWNNADKIVDQRSPIENPWESTDPEHPDFGSFQYGNWEYQPDISNRFRNNFMNQDIRLGYKKVNSKYNLDAGLSLTPSMSKSIDLINSRKSIPERWVWNFAPFVRFRYRLDKQSSINIHYNGRSSQPSISQLQPVEDNSNPMNVVKGNQNLDPSFSHNIRLRFQKFYPESQRSIMTMADASVTQNAIITKTIFNENGSRYTTYENVNGVWNGRVMNMVSMPFGSSKQWSFNNNIFVNADHRIGYNNGLRNNSTSIMVAESPSIAFRPKDLELELRPNWRMQTTINSLEHVNNTTVHNYGGTFNGSWYTPIGLVLATDLTYTASSGYSEGYNQKEWMWNASIAYQFLTNRSATLMLKVYDLLQQRSNINRSVTATYIDDTRYNSLTRYFMLSFTYTFNSFGKGEKPEMRDNFGMRGGPDGMRRGGMQGPPPGGMRR